ncbi:MAG: hypothetical protein WC473_02895 [Patescibacteria group bacterium]|jgi:flagellar biosynthesis GTPase FlhF
MKIDLHKLILPVSIVSACTILGGFYYMTEVSKLNAAAETQKREDARAAVETQQKDVELEVKNNEAEALKAKAVSEAEVAKAKAVSEAEVAKAKAASEARAAAAVQQQAEQERENKLSLCLSVASYNYSQNWANACKNQANQISLNLNDCLANGVLGESFCRSMWIVDPSNDCSLYSGRADSVNEYYKNDKDDCYKKYGN